MIMKLKTGQVVAVGIAALFMCLSIGCEVAPTSRRSTQIEW